MATSELTAAIVLVGGRSTRMGADKASLVVDGISMQDRVLNAVAAAGISTVIIAGTEQVPDAAPAGPHAGSVTAASQGPLAGIVGAWRSLQAEQPVVPSPIVVLACDLPWLVADVIADLIDTSRHHTHGAVAHDGERPQPLVAAYLPAALEAICACYDAGERSLRHCSAGWDLGVVPAHPAVVADADTPDDLAGFTVEWPL